MRAKPHDDTRRKIENKPKHTDGTFSLGVSPATSTRLPRKRAATKRSPDVPVDRLDSLPPDALVHVNGNGAIKLVVYHREPQPREQQKPTYSAEYFPHPNLVKDIRAPRS